MRQPESRRALRRALHDAFLSHDEYRKKTRPNDKQVA